MCQALKITPRWINFSTHFKVFPRCDTWMNFLKQTLVKEKFLFVSKLSIFAFDFAENKPYGNYSRQQHIRKFSPFKQNFCFLKIKQFIEIIWIVTMKIKTNRNITKAYPQQSRSQNVLACFAWHTQSPERERENNKGSLIFSLMSSRPHYMMGNET